MSAHTHIFDLDGTLLHFQTQEWLPGALEILEAIHKHGDKILFITARGPHDEGKAWSIRATEKVLAQLTVPYQIVYNVPGPRILHDDLPGGFDLHPFNGPWKFEIKDGSKA